MLKTGAYDVVYVMHNGIDIITDVGHKTGDGQQRLDRTTDTPVRSGQGWIQSKPTSSEETD